MLPGLALIVPFATAIGLLIGTKINYRLGWLLPDGWLTIILITGLFAQIVLAATYLVVLNPAYWQRNRMISQIERKLGLKSGLIRW
jgi:hypothetical protein